MAQATSEPVPSGLALQRDEQGGVHGRKGEASRPGDGSLRLQVSSPSAKQIHFNVTFNQIVDLREIDVNNTTLTSAAIATSSKFL